MESIILRRNASDKQLDGLRESGLDLDTVTVAGYERELEETLELFKRFGMSDRLVLVQKTQWHERVNWTDSFDEDKIDTMNTLYDAFYEDGTIFMMWGSSRDNVYNTLHELCHWIVADEIEREHLNYGTAYTGSYNSDIAEKSDRQEREACCFEVAFAYKNDWRGWKYRADLLGFGQELFPENKGASSDNWKLAEDTFLQEYVEMWNELLG